MSGPVKITAHIRDNATGEVVLMKPPDTNSNDDGSPNAWWWSEGNAGCDCNRRLFFWLAKGVDVEEADEDDDEAEDPNPCGHTAFSVNLSTLAGEVFYREFEEVAH